MINRHPVRVLATLLVLAGAFLAVSYPGRNDKSGAWMYISGLGWIAFLLGLLLIIVLTIYVITARFRGKKIRSDG